MKQIVLNSKLETVTPLSTNTTAKLSPYDDLDNGAIVWAVPEGGKKSAFSKSTKPPSSSNPSSLVTLAPSAHQNPKPSPKLIRK